MASCCALWVLHLMPKSTACEYERRCRCGQEAAVELQRLAESSFRSRASQAGAPVLRLLQVLTAICKPEGSQVQPERNQAV